MKTKPVSIGETLFNNLSKREQQTRLMAERTRQNFNDSHFSLKLKSSETEIGQYLENKVKREKLWGNVLKRIVGKNKWIKLV